MGPLDIVFANGCFVAITNNNVPKAIDGGDSKIMVKQILSWIFSKMHQSTKTPMIFVSKDVEWYCKNSDFSIVSPLAIT